MKTICALTLVVGEVAVVYKFEVAEDNLGTFEIVPKERQMMAVEMVSMVEAIFNDSGIPEFSGDEGIKDIEVN